MNDFALHQLDVVQAKCHYGTAYSRLCDFKHATYSVTKNTPPYVQLHLLPSVEQEPAFPRLSEEGLRSKVANLYIVVDHKKYKAADVVCSVFVDYPVFIFDTNTREDMFTVHVRPSRLPAALPAALPRVFSAAWFSFAD